jgi:flagellar biosynthesis/type III secretory pathway protein FliH
MTGQDERGNARETLAARDAAGEPSPEAERLAALLRDLQQLEAYLTQRGRHTYELAQRFLEHARQDASSRAYDERQATMLEYQHYIWHEIAGLVNKLVVTYSEDDVPPDATGASARPDR